MSLDLKLIGGHFFEQQFVPEYAYLAHYFQGEASIAFVKYYIDFYHEYNHARKFMKSFRDHTGYVFSRQRANILQRRLEVIVEALKQAELSFDMERVELIKQGKYLPKLRLQEEELIKDKHARLGKKYW